MERGSDQGFARAGRGVQDNVFFLEQFEDRRLLCGIKGEAFALGVLEKSAEQNIIIRLVIPGQKII